MKELVTILSKYIFIFNRCNNRIFEESLRSSWDVALAPLPRHVKAGELVWRPSRHVWLHRDGFFLVFICGGFGHNGPTAAALHPSGDPEAALPAAGAPDDRALLGEVRGQAWAEAGQSG